MFSKVKLFIKKILPSSKNQINVKFNDLNNLIQKNQVTNERYLKQISKTCFQQTDEILLLKQQILQLQSEIQSVKAQIQNCTDIDTNNTELLKDIQHSNSTLECKNTDLSRQVETVRREVIQTKRASNEAVWGEIFKDSIIHSKWLEKKCFYPGRWAVGYQYLYCLYRILNSIKPQKILELGLGQSTTMITQYANFSATAIHRVIEHDKNWIDYYQQEFEISERTEVLNLELENILFQSQYELFRYKNFKEQTSDMIYDFISIDAPFGGVENEYSRIDVLDILPDCLASSFIIMIDDVNRKGEQNTIKLIEEILTNNDILFSTGKYIGNKDAYVIASMDNKFVCTL